jgi:transcriptional regulator GlxA family with amidase domain
VSGAFSFESTALHPLVSQLPDVLHVQGDEGLTARWLESTLQFMASEMHAEEPGYELVASRLADVLLVQALRSHVRSGPCDAGGFLRALGDPHLGVAFQRMHAEPDRPWTVETLARAASMSRSAFAARFRAVLGTSPLTYLTKWRIYRATELLTNGKASLSEVANAVGYETDGAFVKAFKRHLGETPGAYRRRRAVKRATRG